MRFALALAAVVALNASANAAVFVTEIWAGGLPGSENTSDWFELTNTGTTAVTDVATYFYDDDSEDPTKDDALVGVSSLAPGESAIFVVSWEDDFTTSADAIAAFTAMWGAPNGDLSTVQIGYVDGGSGLGGGDDGVFIFDGNTAGANEVASGSYSGPTNEASFIPPFGSFPDLLSVNGVAGAYEGNLDATSSNGAPPIGSPGIFIQSPVVPEPTSILVFAGLAGVATLRRR